MSHTSALQTIDQLAMYVPASKIIKAFASSISDLLKTQEPSSQRAGLLILSVIVEGCAEQIMSNHMEELVPMICQHLDNENPAVRTAAYFAIGQCSEHLHPDIADYAEVVMPKFMKIVSLGPTSSEFQNRDVATRFYYALETFVESLHSHTQENALDRYIDELMTDLLKSLVDHPDLSHHLKGAIVGTIGAVANAADEKFVPFLDQTANILQNYFPTEEQIKEFDAKREQAEATGEKLQEEDDRSNLWSRSILALASICRAIGAEDFMPYASKTLELAVFLSNAHDDPDIKASSFSLFAGLAVILGDDMQPHMEMVCDILFRALKVEVLDYTGDQTDEARVKKMATMLELTEDLNETRQDAKHDLEDYGEMNLETAGVETKTTALETLCEMAEYCTASFGPFMGQAYVQAPKKSPPPSFPRGSLLKRGPSLFPLLFPGNC